MYLALKVHVHSTFNYYRLVFFLLTYNSLKQFLFQQKLILHRQNNFYRVKSGYFRSDEDVKNQAKEKLAVRFPEIPIEKEIKVEKVYTEYRYEQI